MTKVPTLKKGESFFVLRFYTKSDPASGIDPKDWHDDWHIVGAMWGYPTWEEVLKCIEADSCFSKENTYYTVAKSRNELIIVKSHKTPGSIFESLCTVRAEKTNSTILKMGDEVINAELKS